MTADSTLGFLLIMATALVPLLLSMGSAFLGTLPYDKKLRETTVNKRSALKKFFGSFAVVLVPVIVLELFIINFPEILSGLFSMVAVFGVFILGVMALTPYLVWFFQDTTRLDGRSREELKRFCSGLGVQLRDIRLMEEKSQKVANAMVAGTIPRFNYIFITDYLVEEFSEDELEAILAHEIGHIKKNHLWIKGLAAFIFFAIWITLVYKTNLMEFLTVIEFYGSFLLTMGVLFFYWIVVQGLLSERLEYQADQYAAEIKGRETTISALEKLSYANTQKKNTGKLYNLLNLHPSIEQRIEKVAL